MFESVSREDLGHLAMAAEVAYKETGFGCHNPGLFLRLADEFRRREQRVPNPYGPEMSKHPDDWMRGFQREAS